MKPFGCDPTIDYTLGNVLKDGKVYKIGIAGSFTNVCVSSQLVVAV